MAPPRSARGYSWINTARAKRIHLEEAIGLVTLTTVYSVPKPFWLRQSTSCFELHNERATFSHEELAFHFFFPRPSTTPCYMLSFAYPTAALPLLQPFFLTAPLSGMKFCNGWHAHTRTYAGKHASTNAHVMVQCYSICTCP